MNEHVTQVRFAKPATGLPTAETWAFSHDPLPEPKEGEVSIRLHYLSIDPAMKGWITNKRSYIESVPLGEVMRGFGVGEVIASRTDYFQVGDFCTGFTGIQTHATLDGRTLRKVDPQLAPLSRYMGGLGMTGFTGYFGLLDIGKPQAGETVVVSSAAGAVGHVVCQIARLKGCRVVGIAGGPDKCRYLREELELDAVIDYRAGSLGEALSAAAPDGIDVYFDGVGGETLDAVLARINRHARIVLCGAVSQYGQLENMVGPGNYMQLIAQSGLMQGFTMRDYIKRMPEAFVELLTWEKQGKLKFREHIVEGIEQFPQAVDMLYRGENHGKLMLKLV
ncbi:NADP-dependent oxidoreductase [Microbulbifer agarilyticus]|uniref:NADP-dependent oxidoreductase n=1 Tax=Microbulbifer agarilyticus TaxID=260552 RepID=UPI001C93844B|nr:NADP-dependent oxidoreductase [Microbulbifer agarilyticus]MBY6191102.1 NADP-dependent oxidoreductase [Microbulbifer agarilyticus]